MNSGLRSACFLMLAAASPVLAQRHALDFTRSSHSRGNDCRPAPRCDDGWSWTRAGLRGHGSSSRSSFSISIGTGLNFRDCDDWRYRRVEHRHGVGCGCSSCRPVVCKPVVIRDPCPPPSRIIYTSPIYTRTSYYEPAIIAPAPIVVQQPPVVVQQPPQVVVQTPAPTVQVTPPPVVVHTPPVVQVATEPTVKVDPISQIELGKDALRRGDGERAVRYLKEHLRSLSTDDGEAQRLLALALLDSNRPDEAGDMMRRAYRTDPGLAELAPDVVGLGVQSKRVRAWTVRAVEFANRENTASAWLSVAVLMQADNRLPLAKSVMDKAVAAGLERQIADPMLDAVSRTQ